MTENASPDNNLTPKQERLIEALLTGQTIIAASKAVGIAEKTAHIWLKLPHVARAYQEARQNIAQNVREQIEQLSSKAIQALDDSLQLDKGMVKFLSAKYILDHVAGDPANAVTQQPQDSQHALNAALMQYMTDEEISILESIMERARVRKAEAEEKITPIRREA